MNDRDIIKEFYRSSPDCEKLTAEALSRLDRGECAAYIIGEWYFWRHTFKVNKSCLIPRPDTELIVEKAIKILPQNALFADFCTGSGCIALSILSERPDLSAVAFDISGEALEAAKENAHLLGLEKRITFVKADLLNSDFPDDYVFDAIISNPPYIRSSVIAEYPSLENEPRIALDGGDDGLVFYRDFLEERANNLTKNGFFLFEIGFDQRNDIEKISQSHGFSCEVTKDYGGNDRVALIVKT